MKLNRRNLLKRTLVAACFLGIEDRGISADINAVPMKEPYENLESLKKGVPWVSKWWGLTVRETVFAVCLQDLPSYGQSKQSVYAWKQARGGSFTLVWSLRTEGVGPIEVVVDKATGKISVEAKAPSRLKDSVIGLVQLAATAG